MHVSTCKQREQNEEHLNNQKDKIQQCLYMTGK